MNDDKAQSYAHEGDRFWNEEGGRIWAEYIDSIDALVASLSHIALERAKPEAGEIVLDVGCGGGAATRAIAARVGPQGRVTGVDISATILAVTQERFGHLANLEFMVGDAQTMVLGEAVFDLIFSRFGVMFFQDPIAAFTNLYRALKPSGRLRCMVWRGHDENPWAHEPDMAMQSVFPPPVSADVEPSDPDAPGPFSLAGSDRIHHILSTAGFADIKAEAVDAYMLMGSVAHAMSVVVGMFGPSAEQMSQASQEQVTALNDAVRRIMTRYETPDGVAIPCAAWMISAQA